MRRLIYLTIVALVAFAAVSGVAAAMSVHSASQDARESTHRFSPSAVSGVTAAVPVHSASQDARESTHRFSPTQADLRSPSPVVSVPASGFDWADAGIGAAGMLALVALGSGALLLASQRRRRDRYMRTATH